MIKTYVIEALACIPIQGGLFNLVLDSAQATALMKDLAPHPQEASTKEPKMQDMRTFFFEEEGYMENDRICQSYYWEHKN